MMHEVPTLAQLVRQLQKLPYLASKNVYRVAHYLITLPPDQFQAFCDILRQAHDDVIRCPRCFVWQERSGRCPFCDSPKRDVSTICVVETWYDLFAIEKSGGFNGLYHVLGGALSPLDGIGPDQLTADALALRAVEPCKEIILAMNQTPEGEATASLVARALQGKQVTITCLARGIPVGSSLEYLDRLTVHKALAERRSF